MKKRIMALLTIIAVLTLVLAMPVMAQEVTDPNNVIKEETFNAEMEDHERELRHMEVYRAGIYLSYLDGVIYNLNETVRVKQEVVNNYKWLSQYNSYYATLIPQAQKDLAEAQAWVDYYKLYKNKVQADFAVRYPL